MKTEDVISKYPDSVIELAIYAHSLIIKTLPNILEYPDEKANIIGYGYSNKYVDLICTIILSKKGIKIGLNRGSELNDPDGLLEGTGKVHKYVQINQPKDLKNTALKKLLKQGFTAWEQRVKK